MESESKRVDAAVEFVLPEWMLRSVEHDPRADRSLVRMGLFGVWSSVVLDWGLDSLVLYTTLRTAVGNAKAFIKAEATRPQRVLLDQLRGEFSGKVVSAGRPASNTGYLVKNVPDRGCSLTTLSEPIHRTLVRVNGEQREIAFAYFPEVDTLGLFVGDVVL